MAVPSTGSVSMRGIRREIGTNNYSSSTNYSNVSLEDMSEGVNGTINTASTSRPDGTNPHKMSEFRGYDHDAGPALTQKYVSGGTALSSSSTACTNIAASFGYFSNLNSSGVPVTYSSYMYSNSSGTSTFGFGWRSFGPNFLPTHAIRAQSSGLVTHVVTCSGGGGFPSDTRLKKNIKLIGVSKNGINIYSFEYKSSDIGTGVFKGVMADEVEHIKNAVTVDENGYKRVNYSVKEIDVEFDAIEL